MVWSLARTPARVEAVAARRLSDYFVGDMGISGHELVVCLLASGADFVYEPTDKYWFHAKSRDTLYFPAGLIGETTVSLPGLMFHAMMKHPSTVPFGVCYTIKTSREIRWVASTSRDITMTENALCVVADWFLDMMGVAPLMYDAGQIGIGRFQIIMNRMNYVLGLLEGSVNRVQRFCVDAINTVWRVDTRRRFWTHHVKQIILDADIVCVAVETEKGVGTERWPRRRGGGDAAPVAMILDNVGGVLMDPRDKLVILAALLFSRNHDLCRMSREQTVFESGVEWEKEYGIPVEVRQIMKRVDRVVNGGVELPSHFASVEEGTEL